jgi:asparagine synthase (glutamine-hydrolysing)
MRETTQRAARLDSFTSVSYFEMQWYMVNTLLRDTDIASMANSLEVRVPFLDHRLVEFVARLPKDMKYRSGMPKSLLVQAMAGALPDAVVSQSKRTFTLPYDVWLRGSLGVRVSQELANLDPALLPYLSQRAVRGSWQNFVSGHTNWSRPWSIYVLNHWVRRNLTGTDARAGSVAPAMRPAAAHEANPRS